MGKCKNCNQCGSKRQKHADTVREAAERLRDAAQDLARAIATLHPPAPQKLPDGVHRRYLGWTTTPGFEPQLRLTKGDYEIRLEPNGRIALYRSSRDSPSHEVLTVVATAVVTVVGGLTTGQLYSRAAQWGQRKLSAAPDPEDA